MDEFRTIGKLWPSGDELDLGTDSNILGGPATFTRNAPGFVTSPDGATNYQFLFWNTGRHVTSKRRVRWNFSVLGWGTWTATRWYGTPSGGPGGPPRVHAETFSIGNDDLLAGATPIDAGASSFAAGAHPFGGSDRQIGTADGPATVVAKDPFNARQFAGWLKMIWGGDPSGEFVETDAGTSGTFGGTGYYDHVNVLTGAYHAAQGTSADLLALYGTHDDPGTIQIKKWFEEVFRTKVPFEIPQKGDPSPMDLIRMRILEQMLERTQPNAGGGGGDFQKLIESAPGMNRDELKRALMSVKTSLSLGETALAAIEGRLRGGEG